MLQTNKDKVEITGKDLCDVQEDLWQKLKNMNKLKMLKLESCRIDAFEPESLRENLRHLSLRRNNIRNFDQIVFDWKKGNCVLGDK